MFKNSPGVESRSMYDLYCPNSPRPFFILCYMFCFAVVAFYSLSPIQIGSVIGHLVLAAILFASRRCPGINVVVFLFRDFYQSLLARLHDNCYLLVNYVCIGGHGIWDNIGSRFGWPSVLLPHCPQLWSLTTDSNIATPFHRPHCSLQLSRGETSS